MRKALVAVLFIVGSSCAVSSHASAAGTLGKTSNTKAMLAVMDAPGPLTVETVNSADWAVPLSGLLNVDNPKAKAAGKVDAPEPIQVFFHVITHPTLGTFLIDTGVEKRQCEKPSEAAVQGMVASFMKTDTLKCHMPLADYLATHPKLAGVFITHLHIDHIWGMPDVAKGTPIYTGPKETAATSFQNMFVQGPTDELLEGQATLSEWQYVADPDGQFDGVIDVFGDGSLWALWVPGHTMGSTAFVARTADGPILFTGDASHTAWGWQNDVEPGTFTADAAKGIESLKHLRDLSKAHPNLKVRLGHQVLPEGAPAVPAGEVK